jgi:hypothetical protein
MPGANSHFDQVKFSAQGVCLPFDRPQRRLSASDTYIGMRYSIFGIVTADFHIVKSMR